MGGLTVDPWEFVRQVLTLWAALLLHQWFGEDV
jgi:hypothetical protein